MSAVSERTQKIRDAQQANTPAAVVAVTGGRNYKNGVAIWAVLRSLDPRPALLLHGAATGADSLAAKIAADLGIPTEAFPADWKKHGRAAGPIRNQQIIDRKPDLLLAFPGGIGTENMVRCAERAGIPVRRCQ